LIDKHIFGKYCVALSLALWFFTQMHKKAFDDWAYSAPPYLAGLEGWGAGKRQKGGGKRQDTSSPYQQFLDPPLGNTAGRFGCAGDRCASSRQPPSVCSTERISCLSSTLTGLYLSGNLIDA